MPGEELSEESLSPDGIYRALYDDILAGVIGPGAFLREEALAERFGVSRTPVREALKRLEAERILERWKRGRRVPTLAVPEMLQAYDLRALLEGEAAAQAAESRSTSDLYQLDRMMAHQRSLGTSDLDRLTANFEFHSLIWSAARNPVLDDVIRSVMARLLAVRSSTFTEDRWSETLREHAAIVEAIRERDAEKARELASTHIQGARRVREEMIAGRASAYRDVSPPSSTSA